MSGTRFLVKSNQEILNPPSGTLVDTGIVENQGEKEFDFYLVPHNATVATANPVYFKVVYNTSDFEKKEIQKFTHHLCFGYYGFCGPIKVPAMVMYAKKIATFCSEVGIQQPNELLRQKFFYL